MRRLDDEGPEALVQTPVPVHRFDDAEALVVQELSAAAPKLGRRKLAQFLTRAGLVLADSTVKRLKQRKVRRPEPPEPRAESSAIKNDATPREQKQRRVTAREPHHLWHTDITTVPTGLGFWVPWWPFSLVTRWIFSWHFAFVLDHYSRALLGWAVFRKEPTAAEVCSVLDRAIDQAGRAPKYIVTDRGSQFQGDYRAWCARRGVKPRFGAIGQHGSVAIIERFILSLKNECLRRILVPFALSKIEGEMQVYATWYNTVRPHTALDGLTPSEVLEGRTAPGGPRFEPRPRVPLARASPARPKRPLRRVKGRLELRVTYLDEHRHLPVVELRDVA
jgi:transposase InsO family protein